MLELILGGARSGKSSFAESLVAESGLKPCYLATAAAHDDEMHRRIMLHQDQREQQAIAWSTHEEPVFLADSLARMASDDTCILVDCLTLWVSNCLLSDTPDLWRDQKQALLAVLPELSGRIIMVSNEVGQGIIPLGEINRRFVDESGWLHQAIARIANSVRFIVAGYALQFK